MKAHPCKARDLLLRRAFTGVRSWLRSELRRTHELGPTSTASTSWPSIGVLFFYSTGVFSAVAEDTDWYRFEEGEPLTYKMEVGVTNETLIATHFYDQSDKSRHNESLALTMDYQLMPIVQQGDGLWKMRLLLNQLEQIVNRDGDVQKKTLDRAALRDREISGSALMKKTIQDHSSRLGAPEEATSSKPGLIPAREVHSPEDLFDEPLLVWIKSNGILQKFEDRTELQQVIPGINLKECIELVLPPLLVSDLQEGTQWTRDVPVDLPATPIEGDQPEPMRLKLDYAVRKIESIDGRRCARIALKGRFVRDGLSIPIRQEEMKYLIWTTSITRVADQVEGEFIFDLSKRTMRTSEITSVYNYATLAGRKQDKYRGRITSENEIRTRLVSRLVSAPTAISLSDE